MLNRKLKPLIKERPELAEEQQQLEDLITRAKALQSEQVDMLGKLRDAIKLRRAAEATGQELHGRIVSVLKGKLGFKSNDLLAYGLQPRRSPVRKKKDTPVTPPPAAASSAPAPHPPAKLTGPATES
jgi:hypothetical protein